MCGNRRPRTCQPGLLAAMKMDLQLIAQIITTSLVASGAAWAVVAYLSKTLLTQKLAQELERYKSGLNQEVEAFKLFFSKELHGFSTQFSRLDQQRASGVMEIHGLMCDIEQLVILQSGAAGTALITLAPEARTMEALNKAWEGIANLNHVLNYHALLLTEEIYAHVQEWSKVMMAVVSSIGNEIEPLRKQAGHADGKIDEREAIISAIRGKYLDSSLPELGSIRKELETEFRKILGAETSS
jgi:hypothetical protein